jgi:asparagine synthase (glutamine-hydrolysing)
MCGIFGYLVLKNKEDMHKAIFEAFIQVQMRGPDRSEFKQINEFITSYLGFHRLAIMDRSTSGDQPFTLEIKDTSQHRSLYTMCNGEIYNFHQLAEENNFKHLLKSRSDCETIQYMHAKYGFTETLKQLRGEFAISILEVDHMHQTITLHLGRDQTAVRPLFLGIDENGIAFGSTLRSIVDIVQPDKIKQVARGESIQITVSKNDSDIKMNIESNIYHILDQKGFESKFINSDQLDVSNIPSVVFDSIYNSLVDAVECRLESDRPLGALLSGGLDSSLVVSIAAKYLKSCGQGKRLKTFSIGIPGSTDKEYAEMVAKHCDTDHTHCEFTEQEFLDAIPEVIGAIESYDITTVRASVGQFLISRWIKQNTDIRVLLIGDGSDELCSGYMYFHNAPTDYDSHLENVRLLEKIQYFDVLRADRCIAYNGLEARVPFLDHRFVDLYLSIPPQYRVPMKEESVISSGGRRIEKWLLRKSFDRSYEVKDFYIDDRVNDIPTKSYLPDEVLWRKKEAFSDGVSSNKRSWYQVIQENVDSIYTDDELKLYQPPGMHLKPITKEALHYRYIFNKKFHPLAATVIPEYWMPRWSGNVNDPSARILKVYDA